MGVSRLKRILVPLLLIAFPYAATSTFAQKGSEATQSTSTGTRASQFDAPATDFAGPERCRSCHKNETVQYEQTSHLNVDFPGKKFIHGCETCHGPAKAHADAIQAAHGDDDATAKALKEHPLFVFRGSGAENAARCLQCHVFDQQHANFSRSAHSEHDLTCISCHSPHHAASNEFLLAKTQPELCYSCHLKMKAQFNMPFHHRVEEGLVQCADCHNPHGGFIGKQLRSAAARDTVCFTCHADKQGPFVFEHQPNKTEGCEACHSPHGSPNPHLLKTSNLNVFCLKCHTGSTFSSASGTPDFHNEAAQYQACTLCHEAIHGSNFDRHLLK